MNTETSTELSNQPVSYGQYTQASYEPPHEPLIPTRYVVIGVIVALVLMAAFTAFVVWAARYHATTIEALRDIFIIALALESCIFGIALMILLVMVIRLVNMLEFEIKPILERTNETIGMVRGTTVFMSENVVKPMTTASSYAAGIRRGMRTLFGNPKNNLK
jgi:hypothetical protein